MQAQGALSQILMLMEPSYNTPPTGAYAGKSKKVYFSTDSLQYSRTQEQSKIIRGSSRHPTRAIAGTSDVGGSINSELMATSALLYAALGSVSITGASVTVGAALTTPTFAYDWTNQILTVTCGAVHSLAIGDTVEIIATAPAVMNGTFYYPVIDVTSTTVFKVRVPMGGSGTITLTSIKPCTAGTFTYTYKAGGKLPSYIVEKGFPDIGQYFKYGGVVNSKLGLKFGPTGVVEFTSEWMGAQETPDQTSFDSGTPLDNTKIAFDSSMLASADFLEGGSECGNIKGFDLTIDNALDGDTFVVGGGGVRGGLPSGNMYSNTSTTITVASSGTWYEVDTGATDFTSGQLTGVTFSDHYLVVPVAGKYTVHASASVGTSAAGDEVAVSVMVNGTAQDSCHAHATVASATTTVNAACSTILSLAANDQVSLAIQNHSAARNVTLSHSQVVASHVAAQ